MTSELSSSVVFLTVQAAGVLLVAALFILLARETGRRFVWRWAVAWCWLAVALFALLAVLAGRPSALSVWAYLFGEYAFVVTLRRGLLEYRGVVAAPVRDRWTLAALALFAAGLVTAFGGDFNALFPFHAPVFATLVALSLFAVRRPPDERQHLTGTRLTRFALALLALDFFLYPLVSWLRTLQVDVAASLLQYNSLVDLILEIALGFGLVLLSMERITVELSATNLDLARARDRLQVQANVDPLTSALNRHAFYTMFDEDGDGPKEPAGCVVVIDIDNLKRLNDTLGHAAGDRAIRTAAKIIRGAIRSDDLLFRWGGDEFLVLLFGMSESDAHQRLRALNQQRAEYPPLPHLSWGLARFEDARGISAAIEGADRAMYDGRELRRRRAE